MEEVRCFEFTTWNPDVELCLFKHIELLICDKKPIQELLSARLGLELEICRYSLSGLMTWLREWVMMVRRLTGQLQDLDGYPYTGFVYITEIKLTILSIYPMLESSDQDETNRYPLPECHIMRRNELEYEIVSPNASSYNNWIAEIKEIYETPLNELLIDSDDSLDGAAFYETDANPGRTFYLTNQEHQNLSTILQFIMRLAEGLQTSISKFLKY